MVGSGIKYFRKVNNIKQSVFAKKLGTTQPFLSLIESDKTYPSFEIVTKASKILKIPIPILFWFGMEAKDFKKNEYIAKILKPKIDKMILTLIK